jgi:hypothetical protein
VTGISLTGSVGNRGEWPRHAFAANGHKVPSGTKQGKKSTSEGASPPAPTAAAPTVYYNEYVRAGAWSLRHPYYSHFLYSPDDYRN